MVLFRTIRPPVPVHEGRVREASQRGGDPGACSSGLRGLEAREVGPAQERSRQRWRACSPEARPLCTTAELWQVQRKAEVRSRDGESSVGDAPRQECGAGANRNRRTCRVLLGPGRGLGQKPWAAGTPKGSRIKSRIERFGVPRPSFVQPPKNSG